MRERHFLALYYIPLRQNVTKKDNTTDIILVIMWLKIPSLFATGVKIDCIISIGNDLKFYQQPARIDISVFKENFTLSLNETPVNVQNREWFVLQLVT